jgi:hypothetical protein
MAEQSAKQKRALLNRVFDPKTTAKERKRAIRSLLGLGIQHVRKERRSAHADCSRG